MQKLLPTNWTAAHELRHFDVSNNYTLMTDYVLEDALFYQRLFAYYPVSEQYSLHAKANVNYVDDNVRDQTLLTLQNRQLREHLYALRAQQRRGRFLDMHAEAGAAVAFPTSYDAPAYRGAIGA
jgi:hypothetical protein